MVLKFKEKSHSAKETEEFINGLQDKKSEK